MKLKISFLLLCLSLTLVNCKQQATETPSQPETVLKPESWIDERVEKASERLQKTEGGQIIWKAMQAHGGLKQWYSNGALSFRFDYKPLDGKTRRNSYQTIDVWSSKARHQGVSDTSQQYGWDGEKAWKKVNDSTVFPYDMRFWSLTPYYFLGQPFVFDGEGINFEKLPNTVYKNKTYHTVKITYNEGVGEAPDDYYILYFGKDDYKLAVIRYIVSYPAYFKNGGHNPEKLMEIQGTTTVDGIELATGYKTFWLTEDEKAGEHITDISVSDISFDKTVKNTYFDIPEGAEIIE
ncbi:hypothetical protein [Joostella sp. CR20]|uniref:hypothetical protein n=1 Tax=Joostella sp. CR20 TaxID=2804312 RepID=UPI00313B97CA